MNSLLPRAWLRTASLPALLALLIPAHTIRAQPAASPETTTERYEYRAVHNPDGIGKFYEGREIAAVMGHEGAAWLERPQRITEEHPDQLVQALDLRPGQTVADIGSGTGYFTRRMAPRVAPGGRVLAVDIQPEMLTLLTNKMAALGVTNVTPILGSASNPNLPAQSVDLVLMVDVYHEFAYPFEMMRHICEALKPGGKVVFVEYRGEDPRVPIKPLHKMTEPQVRKEMAVQPLAWVETKRVLPRQHIIIFQKAATASLGAAFR